MMTMEKAHEREEIESLLPWHAAGTLNRRDAQRVEQALAQDAGLARQYEAVREELGEIAFDGQIEVESTGASAFSRGGSVVPFIHVRRVDRPTWRAGSSGSVRAVARSSRRMPISSSIPAMVSESRAFIWQPMETIW